MGFSEDRRPREFKDLRGPFAEAVKGLLSGGAGDPLGGIPSYSGEFAAPISEGETAALGQIAALANNQARQCLLQDTLSGKFVEQGNPFLRDAIEAAQRPTAEHYEQVLGRTLPGQFTAAGHQTQAGQSSPFAHAAAIESRGFANALKDIATNMSFASHEAERGRQQQAIQLSQQEVDTGIKNLQAQALPRLIEQHGLDQGLQEFQQRTQALLSLLATLSGGTLQQTSVTNKQSPDIIGGIFGTGGPGLAGAVGGVGTAISSKFGG